MSLQQTTNEFGDRERKKDKQTLPITISLIKKKNFKQREKKPKVEVINGLMGRNCNVTSKVI